MKSKQILLVFFCAAIFSAARGQTVKNDLGYRKFRISIDAGLDYALGTSGTAFPLPVNEAYPLPSASKNWGIGFDGAYFLTKNYGVGLKYRLLTAKGEHSSMSDPKNIGHEYDPVREYLESSFKEQTHIAGPSFYARWFLGQSRWNVTANAGIVCLINKISNIKAKRWYYTDVIGPGYILTFDEYRITDHTGITAGLTLSAGIRYQLTPATGISVSANGLFASLSRMKHLNWFSEEYETVDIARRINRTGVSAGIDYNF